MRIIITLIGCFSMLMGFSQQQFGIVCEAAYGIRIKNNILTEVDYGTLYTHSIGLDYQHAFGEKNTHACRVGLHYLSTKSEREIERFNLTSPPFVSFLPSVLLTEKSSLHYASIPIQYIHKNKISHMGIGICLNYFLHGKTQVEEESPNPVFLSGRKSLAFGPRISIGLDFSAWDQFLISPEATCQLLFPGSGMNYFTTGLLVSIRRQSSKQ